MYICPQFILQSDSESIAALAIHFILKLVSPDHNTAEFIRNVCPEISRSEMKKLRRYVWEKVYML